MKCVGCIRENKMSRKLFRGARRVPETSPHCCQQTSHIFVLKKKMHLNNKSSIRGYVNYGAKDEVITKYV